MNVVACSQYLPMFVLCRHHRNKTMLLTIKILEGTRVPTSQTTCFNTTKTFRLLYKKCIKSLAQDVI